VQLLSFRVMRLCKPSISVETPLKLDLAHDMFGPDVYETASASGKESFRTPHSSRIHLEDTVEASGVSGLLELPQTFGNIYLGEIFSSFVSVVNHSEEAVTSVTLKAEVQTERHKSILYDNTSSPLPLLAPGTRHDFIASHDVKELSQHTLVCTATYTCSDGERKHFPQYFKFTPQNPLSVRTKVRAAGDDTLLETCVENRTKAPLLISLLRFDPAPHLSVEELEASGPEVHSEENPPPGSDPIGDYMRRLRTVQPDGGTRHFLFLLRREGGAGRPEASNSLGRLEIRWHGNMGEAGRLQTQQIMGAASSRKELELKVTGLPPEIWIHRTFEAELTVQSHVDGRLGPLRLVCGGRPAGGRGGAQAAQPGAVVATGPDSVVLPELAPFGSASVKLRMVAVEAGVQAISGVSVLDEREGKPYSEVTPTQVFVHAA